MKTAVARYQQLQAKTGQRPNKRIRKAAWHEVGALLSQGIARDRAVIDKVQEDARTRVRDMADALYGAQKYGRDTAQPIIIPTYNSVPPKEPEMGFRLVAVLGKRKHLWYDGAWVELSGALMREVSSHGLRVELALACKYQEARAWANHSAALRFRDQTIEARHYARGGGWMDDADWPHAVPRVGVR